MRLMVPTVVIALFAFAPVSAQSQPDTVHKIGNGVRSPVLVSEVKPDYTEGAMRRKVQGTVELVAVVKADGTVGDVRVVRSLDPELDQQGIAAVKQWTFKPGTKDDVPVNVELTVEVRFTLRDGPPAYRIGDPGVKAPVMVKEVKPQYNDDAKKAGIQGTVTLEGVVGTDGTVSAIHVTKTLDPRLDEQAVKAFSQWQFKPGEKDGKPVRVRTTVEMTFTIR